MSTRARITSPDVATDVQADLRELTYAFHSVSGCLLSILNEGDPMVIRRFADDLDEFAHAGGRNAERIGLVAHSEPNKHLRMLAASVRRQNLAGFLEID